MKFVMSLDFQDLELELILGLFIFWGEICPTKFWWIYFHNFRSLQLFYMSGWFYLYLIVLFYVIHRRRHRTGCTDPDRTNFWESIMDPPNIV